MAADRDKKHTAEKPLNEEQEELLELYLHRLDFYLEELKAADTIQVEIETQHLKKILHK